MHLAQGCLQVDCKPGQSQIPSVQESSTLTNRLKGQAVDREMRNEPNKGYKVFEA